MTSVDDAGNVGPARKATGFMTNDEYITEAVDRRYFGGHDHIQLLGCRAKACERYPPRLVAAMLRALRQSMRATGCGEAQGLHTEHLVARIFPMRTVCQVVLSGSHPSLTFHALA